MVYRDWPEVKLAEICDSIDYGYTQSASEAPVGPKFLRITDIVGGSIDWGKVPFCEVDSSARSQYKLEQGDIVIARTGATTGVSAYVANPPDAVFASYLVRLKVGRRANARFISYFLRSPHFWEYIRGVLGDKSAQPNASARTMTQVSLRLPPLEEQEAIAHILGTLDDKIELNRRMNGTLGAMAQAIFKSWFVDFDPVRAKAEGRRPFGMDPTTAALFPDSFQGSPLGKIPKGWKAGKADQILTLCRKTVSPGDYPDELFAHYSIPAFDEGRVSKVEAGGQIKSNKFLVPAETVLLSKLNPRIPRVWLPQVSKEHRPVASTEFLIALPRGDCTRSFLYALFGSDSFLETFSTLVTGTSGSHQRVKPEYLLEMPMAAPSRNCIVRFSETVDPLFKRVAHNLEESRTLAAIRDALLPKLVSGEICIKDATRPAGVT